MVELFNLVGELADGVVINAAFLYLIIKINRTMNELVKAVNELIVHNQAEHGALMHTSKMPPTYPHSYRPPPTPLNAKD